MVNLATTCERPAALGVRGRESPAETKEVTEPMYVARTKIATRQMIYRRCGRSGLKLPAISLGLWHNFGGDTPHEHQAGDLPARRSTTASPISTSPTITARRRAAPRKPSARSCAPTFAGYRDELIISSKAGYLMWPGPYGEWGSRKYLIASCDQSPASGWASTMSTSSIPTASTPTRRWKKPWARSTRSCARAGRSMPGSRPTIPSARARRRRSSRNSARPA